MKPLVLHGPAINISRQKLINLKQKFNPDNIVVFEKGTDLQIINNHLMTPSLFNAEQLIIVENPSEDFIYTLYPIAYTLLLWFDHEVSEKKEVLNWAKKQGGQILFFPETKEASIFPLLDLLGSKDKKAFLEIQKLQRQHEKFADMQYLQTMVFYLLRSLVISNPKAPLFVKQRQEKQRKNFPDISKMYKLVLETDFKIKSGLLEPSQAEFLLVNKFIGSNEH